MASRRDELKAYTFAKRRMLAAFLQPSATLSEENAPRPVRSVVPSIVIGIVVLAVFGAWGLLKPTAPKGWDTPGENVIIASKSTTRYVVLKTGGKPQLHPVLNMASARLLLNDPGQSKVVNVDESVLDHGGIHHGVTIGIPYAPDRLPDPSEARAAKHWAVCQRSGGEEGKSIQKAAFVFAAREQHLVDGPSRLQGGELLYVQGPEPDRTRYVVDAQGVAYPLDDDPHVLQAVVRGAPQQVSKDWLDTLHDGDKITFPPLSDVNTDAGVSGQLDPSLDKVGMVLTGKEGGRQRHYIVLRGRVAAISDFMANLLLSDPDLVPLGQNGTSSPVSVGSFTTNGEFGDDNEWPQSDPDQVNSPGTAASDRNTVCNVLRSVRNGAHTTLSTWAGTAFPTALPAGSSSAYVTPGSGQLFRQVQGSETGAGGIFLVTDTGLRYVLQDNGDSDTEKSCVGRPEKKNADQQTPEAQQARALLGYQDVPLASVPAPWSTFLPTGPRLSRAAACQPQGS